jgi:hypothetical protein
VSQVGLEDHSVSRLQSDGMKDAAQDPTGKMKQLFEAASRLTRSQQQKIAAVLEAFVNQHAAR